MLRWRAGSRSGVCVEAVLKGEEMRPYNEFRPTVFDRNIPFGDERDDWLVLSVGQTRDSGCLEQSNFAQALEQLGGEGDTVEVHRYGHWGPGWFEIIIIKPGSPEEKTAEEIEAALENYPVLDDEDLSEREFEDTRASWDLWGCSDFVEYVVRELDLSSEAESALEDVSTDDMLSAYFDNGGDYETHSDGPCFQFEQCNIEDLAEDLLTDYKQGLWDTLRQKALMGEVEMFGGIMRGWWDSQYPVSLEELEHAVGN